jgi:hypothetical protein
MSTSELTYEREIPEQDGYYWIKFTDFNSDITECIAEVYKSAVSERKLVTFKGYTLLADERFEFAGPIEKPE